jgi:hypothetical protein
MFVPSVGRPSNALQIKKQAVYAIPLVVSSSCLLRSRKVLAREWQNDDLDRFIRVLFSMVAVATLIDRFTSGVLKALVMK